MKLYVIRHAQAEDFGDVKWGDTRPLTAKGWKQATAIGDYFKKSTGRPELVLTSPVLRAEQTAQQLCETGELESPHIVEWLRCGMRPEQAVSELKAYESFERVVIVGHNPDLYFLLQHLLVEGDAPRHVKKASVTVLENLKLTNSRAQLEEVLHF
ncbi:SixA phosphatase family protein [Rubritalea spongiae]|uniref:SixA phosphatase family protein n=1 Tax=Rubritalea spongiae TaxID=430797 RepID=A0ABW5E4Y4_9BACT